MDEKQLKALHIRYRKRRRVADRDVLVRYHYGFLVMKAAAHKTASYSINEAISAGYIGLLEALKRYDPEKASFTTFAHWWILKYILADKAGCKNMVTIPVSVARMNRKIRILRERGHDNREIKQILNLTHEEFRQYDSVHEGPLCETGALFKDKIDPTGSPVRQLEEADSGLSRGLRNLEDAMAKLTPREQKIVRSRHQSPPTPYSELAKEFEMTGEGVRKLFLAAMDKLKDTVVYVDLNS